MSAQEIDIFGSPCSLCTKVLKYIQKGKANYQNIWKIMAYLKNTLARLIKEIESQDKIELSNIEVSFLCYLKKVSLCLKN